MPRINPTVSQKAKQIYDNMDRNERGHWVSDAIIEKADRDQGNSLEDRVLVLEAEVKELRERLEGK